EVGAHLVRLTHLAPDLGAALSGDLLEDIGIWHAAQADGERIVAIADERFRCVLGRPGSAAAGHARPDYAGRHPPAARARVPPPPPAPDSGAALSGDTRQDTGIGRAAKADGERIVAIADERCRSVFGPPGIAPAEHGRQDYPGRHHPPAGPCRAHRPYSTRWL